MYKDVQYSPLQATPTSAIVSHSKQTWPKVFFIVLVSFCSLSLVYINFFSVDDVNLTVSPHEEALCFPTEKSLPVLADLFRVVEEVATIFITDERVLRTCNENSFNLSSTCMISTGIIFPNTDNSLTLMQLMCSRLKNLPRPVLCSHIEVAYMPEIKGKHVTHAILSSSQLTIHISAFIPTFPNVLQVESLHLPKLSSMNVSHSRQLYDVFPLRKIEPSDNNIWHVTIPEDIDTFLENKKNSRFIDCDRTMAKNFPPSSSPEGERVQRQTRKSMIELKRLLGRLKVPFWLMSGSLLGWYRECKAIEYTTDADFGTWADYANLDMEREMLYLSRRNPPSGLRVFNIFGHFDWGYEVSFLLNKTFKR